MRPLSNLPVSLILLLLPYITLADNDPLLPCAYYPDRAACNEPIDAVTEVLPGSYYVAKFPCLDCSIVEFTGTGPDRKHFISEADNDLVRTIEGLVRLVIPNSFIVLQH